MHYCYTRVQWLLHISLYPKVPLFLATLPGPSGSSRSLPVAGPSSPSSHCLPDIGTSSSPHPIPAASPSSRPRTLPMAGSTSSLSSVATSSVASIHPSPVATSSVARIHPSPVAAPSLSSSPVTPTLPFTLLLWQVSLEHPHFQPLLDFRYILRMMENADVLMLLYIVTVSHVSASYGL